MDYNNLTDDEAVELENTAEVRLLYNILSQYKHGACNRHAAVLAILQLLQPDIQIIPRRGAPKLEDPLKRYEALRQKIELGREIEERIASHRELGSTSPVTAAYQEFDAQEKTKLDECRNLWAEYGPEPWNHAMEQWHAWRNMMRNNFQNEAKSAPAKLRKPSHHKGSSHTRDK